MRTITRVLDEMPCVFAGDDRDAWHGARRAYNAVPWRLPDLPIILFVRVTNQYCESEY
jgi:hypothetical protein